MCRFLAVSIIDITASLLYFISVAGLTYIIDYSGSLSEKAPVAWYKFWRACLMVTKNVFFLTTHTFDSLPTNISILQLPGRLQPLRLNSHRHRNRSQDEWKTYNQLVQNNRDNKETPGTHALSDEPISSFKKDKIICHPNTWVKCYPTYRLAT